MLISFWVFTSSTLSRTCNFIFKKIDIFFYFVFLRALCLKKTRLFILYIRSFHLLILQSVSKSYSWCYLYCVKLAEVQHSTEFLSRTSLLQLLSSIIRLMGRKEFLHKFSLSSFSLCLI